MPTPEQPSSLRLTSIHPFNAVEAQILTLLLKGHFDKEIAPLLGLTHNAVKGRIHGRNGPSIYNKVQKVKDVRPRNTAHLIRLLMHDVVINPNSPQKPLRLVD